MRRLLFVCLFCAITILSSSNLFGQNRKVRAYAFSQETGQPIVGLKATLNGTDGASREIRSDSSGLFIYRVDQDNRYVLTVDKGEYIGSACKIGHLESDTLIVFRLNRKYGHELPAFRFGYNSSEVRDTFNFRAWDLNLYSDTVHKIEIIGYTSPDEPLELGLRRAQEVVEGFVKRGAVRKSFIVISKAGEFPLMEREYADPVVDGVYTRIYAYELDSACLATSWGPWKEATYIYMRVVRMGWANY